jgi:gamma-glutamylcyclotransferase (GGCT)/AIG2-like uncharacterized protein YtfP
MSKRLYVAYGSNLNIKQMKYRCPTAKLEGTGYIKDYELLFKGRNKSAFATIGEKSGSYVPVAVWSLQPLDERSLDRYEGYPSMYFKTNVTVSMDDKDVKAMVYIMNQKMDFGVPSPMYFLTVKEGYRDQGFDVDILFDAMKKSANKMFTEFKSSIQDAVDCVYGVADTDDEELEDEETEVTDEDESDPFYYSNDFHL